jgi:hypothetical protein
MEDDRPKLDTQVMGFGLGLPYPPSRPPTWSERMVDEHGYQGLWLALLFRGYLALGAVMVLILVAMEVFWPLPKP